MDYKESINDLLRKFEFETSEKDNCLWNSWVDLAKEGEFSALLHTLLRSGARNSFKAKAIIVLLAPDLQILPFRCFNKDQSQNYLYYSGSFELESFPKEFVRFGGELICLNIDYLTRDREITEEVRNALFVYNRFIIKFLTVLPEDDNLASRLFRLYQSSISLLYNHRDVYDVDYEEYYEEGGEDDMSESGYDFLFSIITNKLVPLKWKLLADEEIRKPITSETESGSGFMCLRRYIYNIGTANCVGDFEYYPRELFVSQISFVMELPIDYYGKKLLDSWKEIYNIGAMAGNEFRETRHKLARQIILDKKNDFLICLPSDRVMASNMLKEFGAEDKQLAEKLDLLVSEADKRESDQKVLYKNQDQKKADLLTQMR